MHRQRPALGRANPTRPGGVVVEPLDDPDIRTLLAHPVDLRGGRGGRDEDLGVVAQPASRERDGKPVVAAARGDHAARRDVGGEHLAERAARLERAGVLQELELDRDRNVQAEGSRAQLDDRRPSHVGGDPVPRREDVVATDER